MFAPDTQVASNKQILSLRDVVLPYNLTGGQGLDFDLVGAQRIALIDMLNQYQGALIIVSHDMAFLNQLNLTDQLQWQTKHQAPDYQAW